MLQSDSLPCSANWATETHSIRIFPAYGEGDAGCFERSRLKPTGSTTRKRAVGGIIYIQNAGVDLYHRVRPHKLLNDDSPDRREIEDDVGKRIVALPVLGGLHHHYTRKAA